MWGLSLFTAIMLIGVGIVIGMYLMTQIETQINGYKKNKKK